MKLFQLIFVTVFIILSVTAAAQRPSGSIWLGVTMPVKINSRWQWHHDAGYRTLGWSANVQQYLYRTGGRFQLSGSASAASGMAFFFTRTSFNKESHEFGNEFRLWQEFLYETETKSRIDVSGRLRTEQRFFEETSAKSAFIAHRIRFRGGLTCRITDKWKLQVSDEYMQQLSYSEFKFDQNRVLVTGVYQLNNAAAIRAGYMYLLWPKSVQHTATVTYYQQILLHGAGKK
jgi:hypothetical protein